MKRVYMIVIQTKKSSKFLLPKPLQWSIYVYRLTTCNCFSCPPTDHNEFINVSGMLTRINATQ